MLNRSPGRVNHRGLANLTFARAAATDLELGAFSAVQWYRLGRGPPKAAVNMRWVRSNIRTGSLSALLALGIQFVLSFGHVHRTEIRWASESSQLVARCTDAASASASQVSSAPAKPIGLASDYCPICAVMVLASSVTQAAAPASPMLTGSIAVRFWALAEIFPTASTRHLFQARAPPFA